MNILLTTSGNTTMFDGLDVSDLTSWQNIWDNFIANLPSFARVGLVIGKFVDVMPRSVWLALAISMICLALGRIMGRR